MVINPERRRLGTPKTKATLEERAEGTSRVEVKELLVRQQPWGRSKTDTQGACSRNENDRMSKVFKYYLKTVTYLGVVGYAFLIRTQKSKLKKC